MNAIHNAILECRTNCTNDDILIEKINQLTEEHGSSIHQAVFQIFTGIDLAPAIALKYWQEIVQHRQQLELKLERKIDLLPCMYDYLSRSDYALDNPRLIEESAYAEVIMQNTHDGLTKLFNRHYFDKLLEQTYYSARRYNNDVSLLFLDIDNFKEINDTFGHAYGDTVLVQVADIIAQQKRDSDIAARYGGEEFVVLMPHTESIHGYTLAERIRRNIEEVFVNHGQWSTSVTISGGLASYPQNCSTTSELVQKADSALYLAKGAGKNCISLYKQEKRRYVRVVYKESVKIKELGFDSSPVYSGESKDICIGGILFENSSSLKIGSRIQVSLPIAEGKPLLLIGTVVRVESLANDKYDIGMTISFKEMEKIASTKIASFLQNTL